MNTPDEMSPALEAKLREFPERHMPQCPKCKAGKTPCPEGVRIIQEATAAAKVEGFDARFVMETRECKPAPAPSDDPGVIALAAFMDSVPAEEVDAVMERLLAGFGVHLSSVAMDTVLELVPPPLRVHPRILTRAAVAVSIVSRVAVIATIRTLREQGKLK